MSDGATPVNREWLQEPLKTIGAQDLMSLQCKHSGFLRKRQKLERFLQAFAVKSLKWRQKFVVLSQGCVYCYGSEYSTHPTQAFSLSIYDRVVRSEDSTMKFCFEIIPEDTTRPSHVFACESDSKRLEWMEYLLEMLRQTHGHSDGRRKTSDYDDVEISMKSLKLGGSLKKRSSLPPLPPTPNEGSGGSLKFPSRSTFNQVPIPKKPVSEYDLESDGEYDDAKAVSQDDPYDDIKETNNSPSRKKHVPPAVPGMKVALPGMASATPKRPLPQEPLKEETPEDYYNEVTPGEYMFQSSDRNAAAEKLRSLEPGYFLVRESRSSPDGKVLSVKTEDGVKEFTVIKSDKGESLDRKAFCSSIQELVIYYMSNNLPLRTQKLTRGYKHTK